MGGICSQCFMPANAVKEINELHEKTLSDIWDSIYNEIYMLSHYNIKKTTSVTFPSKKTYETDDGWKKIYNYKQLDFIFYTLRLGDIKHIYYKERHYLLEFVLSDEMSDDDIRAEYPQCCIKITVI